MKVISPARHLHEVFYALGVLSRIPGGPHHVYFPLSEPAARDDFGSVQAISSRMPWIRTVQRGLPPLLQYGLDLRPYARGQDNRSMLSKMSYYCGFYDTQPWFSKMEATGNHVVLARTLLQQNSLFPWEPLLTTLHKWFPLHFVGTLEEFEAFGGIIPAGIHVSHVTPDWGSAALDACLSASLVVSNHSPAQAVAEGAHIPCIAEVSLSNPDNVYLRPGSFPGFSPRVVIPTEVPHIGGWSIQSSTDGLLNTSYTSWSPPPRGWKVDCPGRAPRFFDHIEDACFHLCRHSFDLNLSDRETARRIILRDNLTFFPEWGEKALTERMFRKPVLALKSASRKVHMRKFLPSISSYLPDLCD